MAVLERAIGLWVSHSIRQAAKTAYRRYRQGAPLRILIIGYSGKSNTGAEVRIAEIVKHLRSVDFGVALQVGVLTLDASQTRRYVPTNVELVPLSSNFFKSLLAACSEYHVGLMAEGSCLTSVTSNTAALFFICAAGIMRAQDKPCIAVGVDGGQLEPWVEREARRHCAGTVFFARSQETLKAFDRLGFKSRPGTDTAWTIEARGPEWAREEMARQGVQSGTPLIGVSAMNPFIRPIRPSLAKYMKAHLTGDWRQQYDKWYFYTYTPERERLYDRYMSALSQALEHLCKISGGDVALIEMEPMDRSHLDDLHRRLDGLHVIRFSARDHNGAEMASVLRRLNFLITSRYHALLLAMAGGVPCVAVSKDLRLSNIFSENGQDEYCLSTHDPDLIERLPLTVEGAWRERSSLSESLRRKSAEGRLRQIAMEDEIVALIASELQMKPPGRSQDHVAAE
jgi:polysaccharide pyruvyl transferase WcaK-like protein